MTEVWVTSGLKWHRPSDLFGGAPWMMCGVFIDAVLEQTDERPTSNVCQRCDRRDSEPRPVVQSRGLPWVFNGSRWHRRHEDGWMMCGVGITEPVDESAYAGEPTCRNCAGTNPRNTRRT